MVSNSVGSKYCRRAQTLMEIENHQYFRRTKMLNIPAIGGGGELHLQRREEC